MELSAFQLSRIYSQGWNAAKKLMAEGRSEIGEPEATKLNPYRASDGAERWIKGFMEALQGKSGSSNARAPNSWRPAIKH